MANGVLSDMDFEKHLNEMGDNQPELIRFIARQQWQMSKLCPVHDKAIKNLQNRNRKEMGAIGSLGAILGAAFAGIIDYFVRR